MAPPINTNFPPVEIDLRTSVPDEAFALELDGMDEEYDFLRISNEKNSKQEPIVFIHADFQRLIFDKDYKAGFKRFAPKMLDTIPGLEEIKKSSVLADQEFKIIVELLDNYTTEESQEGIFTVYCVLHPDTVDSLKAIDPNGKIFKVVNDSPPNVSKGFKECRLDFDFNQFFKADPTETEKEYQQEMSGFLSQLKTDMEDSFPIESERKKLIKKHAGREIVPVYELAVAVANAEAAKKANADNLTKDQLLSPITSFVNFGDGNQASYVINSQDYRQWASLTGESCPGYDDSLYAETYSNVKMKADDISPAGKFHLQHATRTFSFDVKINQKQYQVDLFIDADLKGKNPYVAIRMHDNEGNFFSNVNGTVNIQQKEIMAKALCLAFTDMLPYVDIANLPTPKDWTDKQKSQWQIQLIDLMKVAMLVEAKHLAPSQFKGKGSSKFATDVKKYYRDVIFSEYQSKAQAPSMIKICLMLQQTFGKGDPMYWHYLGDAYLLQNMDYKAAEAYSEAMQHYEYAEDWENVINMADKLSAIEKSGVELPPETDYKAYKATANYQLNNFEIVDEDDAEFMVACLQKQAEAFFTKDKPAEALELIDKIIEIQENHDFPDYVKASTYNWLGSVYGQLDGQAMDQEQSLGWPMARENAKEAYLKSIEYAENANAYLNLSLIYAGEGNEATAKDYMNAGLALLPYVDADGASNPYDIIISLVYLCNYNLLAVPEMFYFISKGYVSQQLIKDFLNNGQVHEEYKINLLYIISKSKELTDSILKDSEVNDKSQQMLASILMERTANEQREAEKRREAEKKPASGVSNDWNFQSQPGDETLRIFDVSDLDRKKK